MIFRQKRYFKQTCKNHCSLKQFIKSVSLFIISAALLIISANFIVNYAISIAIAINISYILIGAVFLSLSTSLPELIFEIKAVSYKKDGMAIGDITGSTVMNSTLILSIVTLVNPIKIDNKHNFIITASFLIIVFMIFGYFIKTKNEITRKEALFLILLYIIFIFLELGVKYFQ
jgi:cation:H+ antiporter